MTMGGDFGGKQKRKYCFVIPPLFKDTIICDRIAASQDIQLKQKFPSEKILVRIF